jgi:hypothetical protein
MKTMMVCKNCAFEFEGKYCPDCGQKAKTKRITTKSVLEEVRKSLVHYDQGFFFTMLQLLRRPGHTIREYLEGKRAMHVKPVKFLLWTTALNFLVFHLVGLDTEMINSMAERQVQNKFSVKFTQYIFDHPAIMLFLMIPNIALFSWLYFRRQAYNYAEHFVLNAYLMGMVSLFGVISNPVLKLIGPMQSLFSVKIGIVSLIWIGYMGWGYVQFFQPPKKKWWTWLKALLAVFSGYLMLIIVISVLIATVVALFWPWLKPYFQG